MSLVKARSVVRRFGELTAVDDISLSVEPGEIVGLLGANGAGKTTLIRMILGLLSPTSGNIEMLGERPSEVDRREIGYVPQGLGLYQDLTVDENLEFVSAAFGVDRPGLDNSLSDISDRLVGDISLGLRRRTAFAAATCHDPSILILDEPTSGVGSLGRAGLWATIHESADQGAGILVSTHYMEEAEECDRVVVMTQGREVAAGPVSEIVGTRTSVLIRDAKNKDLDDLRKAGMTLLADGRSWRVLGSDPEGVRQATRHDLDIEQVRASFEEAFFELAR